MIIFKILVLMLLIKLVSAMGVEIIQTEEWIVLILIIIAMFVDDAIEGHRKIEVN